MTPEERRQYHREWSARNRDKVRAYAAAHYRRNRKAKLDYGRRWREQNPERSQQLARRQHYGLEPADVFSMLKEQIGRCSICSAEFGERFDVDHDHVTGKVRGLLCHRCNVLIALAKDSPHRLRAAIYYLEGHRPGWFRVLLPGAASFGGNLIDADVVKS